MSIRKNRGYNPDYMAIKIILSPKVEAGDARVFPRKAIVFFPPLDKNAIMCIYPIFPTRRV
ncbi:hypothetical protein NIES39_K02190 [Arthrospira platensis NIES-39]|uniref:hypothetical protein n=1 Tax=Limnospira platensis TaxID=118562 RepID=UPI0001D0E365|nr:hypothetical protein NIES39_K02190 [Arthrospira platensis NIES-39]